MNKAKITLIILSCLVIGVATGWLIKGEEHPHEPHEHVAADGTVYTCSMHPQIRQNEPGKCPLCGMDLTPLVQSSGSENPFVMEMTPEAVALSNIQTMKVRAGEKSQKITLSGKIKADEQRITSLTANYAGRLEQLDINFTGQMVKKGQRIGTIYAPDLVNAQKELLETVRSKETNPRLYEATKEKLKLWKITDQQIKALEESGEVQTNFALYATADGIVRSRNVSIGDFVNRGTVLFELINLSRVWVVFDAYESDISGISVGNEVEFTVKAIPGKVFNAKITYIEPYLDPETRVVAIRAEAANPDQLLKPEMFVTGTVSSAAIDGVTIPKSAVLWAGKRSLVYLNIGDREAPAFEMREVTLGNETGNSYHILSGLTIGDEIVMNGVFTIDAAAQLSGKYSMMNRPEQKTIAVDPSFRTALGQLVQDYLSIKKSLVASEVATAQTGAKQAKTSFTKIQSSLLDPAALAIWEQQKEIIARSLSEIANTSDIEAQRESFQSLSNQLIEAVEYFGFSQEVIYRQYCPMAFDNTGAYWLSSESEIRNPYFGDAMLTCGEVKQTYRKDLPVYSATADKAKGIDGHQH